MRDLIRENPSKDVPANGLAAEHNKLVADITALRTKFVSVLAKLDLDAGVTDANFAALHTPAAVTSQSVTLNGVAPV
jgi:hypothetical protein